jgi:hypothetical protein
LFFTDVVVNCFLAYYNENNELVVSHRQIIRNYAKGWMAIDLLACIPLHYAVSELAKDYQTLIRVARLPRLYRLIKIAKFARVLRDVQRKKKN